MGGVKANESDKISVNKFMDFNHKFVDALLA